MGWWAVREALKSGDEDALREELAHEEDPARALEIAKAKIAEGQGEGSTP
ncbi:MAG: hypothetical protein WBV94_03985 [Blastocatellia bacterium]